jgi:acetyl/propionyl-CoA carboxylase alpha subunit
MINSLPTANRGEIAFRIIHTARVAGLQTRMNDTNPKERLK